MVISARETIPFESLHTSCHHVIVSSLVYHVQHYVFTLTIFLLEGLGAVVQCSTVTDRSSTERVNMPVLTCTRSRVP